MNRPHILVTGGAKRIGSLVCRAFAASGWHVIVHYGTSRAAAEDLAADLPSAEIVQCDLADPGAAEDMVHTLAARLDDWRVLVNSAAVFEFDGADRIVPGVFARAMAVNAQSPVRMAQAYLREGRSAAGRCVIDFLDQKLLNINPDFFSYTMAKAAFAAATRMQAMASVAPGDRVYGIAPGAMMPSFDQNPEEHEVSGRMNLLGRLTAPEELAEAALFLAQGQLVSGQVLYVDSGQHLLSQPRDVLYLAREAAARPG